MLGVSQRLKHYTAVLSLKVGGAQNALQLHDLIWAFNCSLAVERGYTTKTQDKTSLYFYTRLSQYIIALFQFMEEKKEDFFVKQVNCTCLLVLSPDPTLAERKRGLVKYDIPPDPRGA